MIKKLFKKLKMCHNVPKFFFQVSLRTKLRKKQQINILTVKMC